MREGQILNNLRVKSSKYEAYAYCSATFDCISTYIVIVPKLVFFNDYFEYDIDLFCYPKIANRLFR